MPDLLVSTTRLVDRTGGTEFELRWTCPHQPDQDEGHNCSDVRWVAEAKWNGTRVWREGLSPEAACLDLAHRILTGGQCRCGSRVALDDDADGCRWRLLGPEWRSSCEGPGIQMPAGTRGDLDAMHRAMKGQRRRRKRR